MAYGDPGGPGNGQGGGYSSGGGFGASVDTGGTRGGSSGGGRDSNGGYGDHGFGGEVDGGGTQAGSGGGGGYSDGFGSEVDTGGVRGSNSGAPSSRAQQATQTRTQARRAGIYSEVDTPGVMGQVTDGAIASFDDDQAGIYGNVDSVDMSDAEVNAQAAENIAAQAKPGILGRVASLAAGLANPVAGLAVDTAARGYAASQMAQAHNDKFGTNVDTGLASNMADQAIGSVGGLVGGKLGSSTLGRVGATMGGVPGAIAGTIGGGLVGSSLGRSVAMDGLDGQGSAPSTGPEGTPGSPTGGNGMDPGGGATMMAGTNGGQPAAQASTAPSDYGPVDFSGYASYAASFFS